MRTLTGPADGFDPDAQSFIDAASGATDTLQWILSDHLASASVTANADGTWNSTIQYTAFGEVRTSKGVTATRYRYTGQLAQDSVGLDYYVARWYDPVTGHFTSADTIVPEIHRTNALDRYSYVLNNPIRFSDPTGYKPCDEEFGCGYNPNKQKRANEKAQAVLKEITYSDVNRTWDKLTNQERTILRGAGWNENTFNKSEYVGLGVKNVAGTLEDPVIYASIALAAGVKYSPNIINLIRSLFTPTQFAKLYRVVGSKELLDIMTSKIFRPDPNNNSMTGKWFTNSPELAAQWGEAFAKWGTDTYQIVEVEVQQAVINQMQYVEKLDGIGPAWYADGQTLELLNNFLKSINIISGNG